MAAHWRAAYLCSPWLGAKAQHSPGTEVSCLYSWLLSEPQDNTTSGASQTWRHYLRIINKSGLKSVGPTSVFPVMVPGLLCSLWEHPLSVWSPGLNSASLDMSCWALSVVMFFSPAVSKSSGKKGNSSLLVFLILHIQFWCLALKGSGAHVAVVILLKQPHWNSHGFSQTSILWSCSG